MSPAPSRGSPSTASPSSPSTAVASACAIATSVLASESRTALPGVSPVQLSGGGAGCRWDGE
jgi:hypothetical protein